VSASGQNAGAAVSASGENTAAPLSAPSAAAPVTSLKVLSGRGSDLLSALKRTGVPMENMDNAVIPQILFVDGAHPPAEDAKELIDKVLAQNGTVLVWGVSPALNRLLPAPVALTDRKASSLLPVAASSFTKGISAADLYLSEMRPPEMIENGLTGAFVRNGTVLLEACNTDWLQWNKQPEYAKTAMILRSEREAKPSGVALAEGAHNGPGHLLVTTLPPAPRQTKEEKVIRQLLTNMGVSLGAGNDVGKPLLKGGDIVRVLLCGSFPANADPAPPPGKPWAPVYSESGQFDLTRLVTEGPKQDAVAYLSFWVSSPRALDDLLLEPNIPVVGMEVTADDAAQVWLNDKLIIGEKPAASGRAEALKLRRGWNHFLIRLIQTGGGWQFSGRLTCNQPDFLGGLESALEKP
jgi:beta-galactosidase